MKWHNCSPNLNKIEPRSWKTSRKEKQGSLQQHINNSTTLRSELHPVHYHFRFMFGMIVILILKIMCTNSQCHQTNNVNVMEQIV